MQIGAQCCIHSGQNSTDGWTHCSNIKEFHQPIDNYRSFTFIFSKSFCTFGGLILLQLTFSIITQLVPLFWICPLHTLQFTSSIKNVVFVLFPKTIVATICLCDDNTIICTLSYRKTDFMYETNGANSSQHFHFRHKAGRDPAQGSKVASDLQPGQVPLYTRHNHPSQCEH